MGPKLIVTIFLLASSTFLHCSELDARHATEQQIKSNDVAFTIGEREKILAVAARIARLDPKTLPADREKLELQVALLSIRDAAELCNVLKNDHQIDPTPWLKLTVARERIARSRLEKLHQRFGCEPGYVYLETTVRGTKELRDTFGDEMLTEVTGVGFWQFSEGPFPNETDFSDVDVETILELRGLEQFWAHHSKLSDEGIMRLSELSSLKELHLAGCLGLTDSAIKSLAKPNLIALDVSGIPAISDLGITSLEKSVALRELNLEGTGVTSESLAVISQLQELRSLKLDHTKIVAGLERLSLLKNLQVLGLRQLGKASELIPGDSLDFLSELKNLEKIDLGDSAISRIQLHRLPKLKQLSIGHSVVKEISLIDLPLLEELYTGYPHSRDDIELERVELAGLDSLARLALHLGNSSACDGVAKGLESLPRLHNLQVRGASMSDQLADAIGQHDELVHLGLPGAEISDRQLSAVLQAKKLRSLDCCGKLLTDVGIRALSESQLQYLKLSGLHDVDPSKISQMKSLAQLVFSDCDLETFDLERSTIANVEVSAGEIRHLRFRNCDKLTRISLYSVIVEEWQVTSCSSISSLFAGGSKLAFVDLRNLPRLERITIQEKAVLRKWLLSELPMLRSVSFWAAEIDPQALDALQQFGTLKNLDISSSSLGDESAKRLASLSSLERFSANVNFSRSGLEQLSRLPLREIKLYRTRESDWTEAEGRKIFSHVPESVVFELELPPKSK